jgi:hypothetical protein
MCKPGVPPAAVVTKFFDVHLVRSKYMGGELINFGVIYNTLLLAFQIRLYIHTLEVLKRLCFDAASKDLQVTI